MRNRKWLAIIMAAAMMFSALTGCGNSGSDSGQTTVGTEENAASASSEDTEKEADSADESKGSGEMVTLIMWGGVPPKSVPQKACDDFNALYADKGIQVEYERFVNGDTGNLKLETNLLSGTGVDIYVTYGLPVLQKRAEGEMALDLTELMERDGFDQKEYFGDMALAYYEGGKPYSVLTKLDQYGIVAQ